MFVINANNDKNNWYLNATTSWLYDFWIDWTFYTMLSTCGTTWFWWCNLTNSQNTWRTLYCCVWWWDWCEEWAKSLIEWYGKNNDIDKDLIFPYNYICNETTGRWITAEFWNLNSCCKSNINFTMPTCCSVNTVYTFSEAPYPISWWKLLRSILSRKTFKWWEIVGKTIKWYLWMYMNSAMWVHKYCNYNYWWKCAWINTCPFCTYTDIWLIHEDWTKNSLIYCAYSNPYWTVNTNYQFNFCTDWCPNNYYDYPWCCCCLGTEYKPIDIIKWERHTEWLVACAWDKIYIQYWITNDSKFKPQVISSCCSYISWSTNVDLWLVEWNYSQNTFSYSQQYPCYTNICLPAIYDCYICPNYRRQWISFSIE